MSEARVLWTAILLSLYVLNGGPSSAIDTDATQNSPVEMFLHLSSSDTSPKSHVSEPWQGDRTFYLWTEPLIISSQGSEFAFIGNLEIIELIPRPGVVNSGTVTSPLLSYGSCRGTEIVAEVIVRDQNGGGGQICFGVSEQNFKNCSQHCSGSFWQSHVFFGFSSDESVPCVGVTILPNCEYVSAVESNTWGRIKSTYR